LPAPQGYQEFFLGSESPKNTISFPQKYGVYSIYSERLSDKMNNRKEVKEKKKSNNGKSMASEN
jgi:hypothetical protein